jgi:hypothetical protein
LASSRLFYARDVGDLGQVPHRPPQQRPALAELPGHIEDRIQYDKWLRLWKSSKN